MKTSSPAKTIFICAGGTGGHVIPGEVLAEELGARGYQVIFITDARGQRFLHSKSSSVRIVLLPVQRGQGLKSKIAYGISLLKSCVLMRSLFQKEHPRALVSFGGYVTFPANLAACLGKVPLMLHEQNVYMGLVNRLFSVLAARVFLSMPLDNVPFFAKKSRFLRTGMLVRRSLQVAREASYQAPTAQTRVELLVLGGSQGTTLFSDVVPQALRRLPEALQKKMKVSLQIREKSLDSQGSSEDPSETLYQMEKAPFFSDVGERLKRAHLVIARAGASTLAELAVAGRPALLIPYPHAAGNHQWGNARHFVAAGAGWLCSQEGFSEQTLAGFLERVFENPSALAFAAERARAQGHVKGAALLVDALEKVLAECP